ncbi:MAG TPA: hypothetical protein VGB94_10365 [Acidobacteriaceae bacterium]
MSDQELSEFLEDANRLRDEHATSPDKALALLVEEGILDNQGRLTDSYQ